MTLRRHIGAWIAVAGIVWSAAAAICTLGSSPLFYIHLAALVMNGEALRYNLRMQQRWHQ